MLGRGEWKKQRVNSSLDKQVGKIRQKQNYLDWYKCPGKVGMEVWVAC